MFVNVKIDSLNESSKFKLSNKSILDKANKLKKKEIKTRNDNLTRLISILLFEKNIFWFTILLGLTNLKISIVVAFNKI